MKKLLLSSIVLFLFLASILLLQIICKKSAVAAPIIIQQHKIIYTKQFPATNDQPYGYAETWTANYDGSNQQKINIILPPHIYPFDAVLSPDGKTIFLGTGDSNTGKNTGLYSCNIDGSNPKLVVQNNSSLGNDINLAY